MLYTSGTTGKPKGVVLSNRNVIESAKNSAEFDKLTAGENILSYLPMAWVGDFIFSVGQAYWCGFCVNCPESADTMPKITSISPVAAEAARAAEVSAVGDAAAAGAVPSMAI